jgi:hypothetical protein
MEQSNVSWVAGYRKPITWESCIHSHGARRLNSSEAASRDFHVAVETCGTLGWVAERFCGRFDIVENKQKTRTLPTQDLRVMKRREFHELTRRKPLRASVGGDSSVQSVIICEIRVSRKPDPCRRVWISRTVEGSLKAVTIPSGMGWRTPLSPVVSLRETTGYMMNTDQAPSNALGKSIKTNQGMG